VRLVIALLVLLGGARAASAEPHRAHVELDPLTFALGGYGVQVGYRPPALPRLRLAMASFAIDVPDPVAELGGNEGFHIRVRPSVGLYGLYFLSDTRGGWFAGGSLRVLRLEYGHDDEPDLETRVAELSLEAIAGYKWHPWPAGFYLLPFAGVSRGLVASDEATVGGREYSPPIVQLFATVNLGWELAL
jgi:hypothetical protein